MKRFLACIFLVFFVFSTSTYAASITDHTLNNGLKVIIIENHKAPIVTFQIWYKVGARNEPRGKTGISHLLEHVMFLGTNKYAQNVLSLTIKKNGGIDNAFTTKDFTVYFQTLPSNKIDLSIGFESDRMRGLKFDDEAFRKEKMVVMEERRMRTEDDPESLLFENVLAASFKASPYHNPVIGWMDDIASITREELMDYYNKYYAPDNAFIVVGGDINPDDIMLKIEKAFGGIAPSHIKISHPSKEPVQQGEHVVYLKKEAQLPYGMIAYHVPSFPNEDCFALDVIESVLNGKSGRLYQDMIEGKTALNAYSAYNSINPDPYLFYLAGTPGQGKDVDALKAAFFDEIEKLKTVPLSTEEIQKVFNQIEAGFIMGQDSMFSYAETIGVFEIVGDYHLVQKYLDGIKAVTPEKVMSVAKKYFTEENRTIGILIPLKK